MWLQVRNISDRESGCCSMWPCTEEHIVVGDIETHVQVLNYSRQIHECFKRSNSAALVRPHLGTTDSYFQCFLTFAAQAALITFESISAADRGF